MRHRLEGEPGQDARDFARKLRRDQPLPERLLWGRLRRGALGGLHFRRQEPVGPFTVDFACLSQRLVIAIDGDSHEDREAHDDKRQRYLEGLGFSVLRFAYEDVTRDLDLVVDAIGRACGLEGPESPLPASPGGGGDQMRDVTSSRNGVLPSPREGQGGGILGDER